MSVSKRLQEAHKQIDAKKNYPLAEAIELVKQTSKVKFDASVEVHINLGIDIKQSDQQVRGTVSLPHGSGKTVRVAAFVPEHQVAEAKQAGADVAGAGELIEQIKKTEKCDFDVAVAVPEIMKELAVVARILGQKGLMPNPKTGTITTNVAKTIQELKKGRASFKNDSFGNLHLVIGKVSFETAKLKENFEAVIEAVKQVKPEKIKGIYLKGIYLTSSMGPSVRVSI